MGIDLNCFPMHGCCKVTTIYEFNKNNDEKKIPSDKDWIRILQEMDNTDGLNRLLVFSHSTKENTGTVTPRAFARWLIDKNQAVTSLHLDHITVFVARLTQK